MKTAIHFFVLGHISKIVSTASSPKRLGQRPQSSECSTALLGLPPRSSSLRPCPKRFGLGLATNLFLRYALFFLISTQGLGTEIAPSPKLLGNIDLRPSYEPSTKKFYTENSVEAGYQFSSGIKLTYLQAFNTNLFDPNAATSGAGFTLQDSFLRFRAADLWKNENLGLALHYQARAYAPVTESDQTAGLITRLRNYFILAKDFGARLKLSTHLVSIAHIHNRLGFETQGSVTANPLFENRVYLIGDITLSSKLSLSLPIMFHQTRYADFKAGAAKNSSWGYVLWIWPELTYSVTDNIATALSYYSGNMVASDLSALALSSGLENGVVQVSFQYNI